MFIKIRIRPQHGALAVYLLVSLNECVTLLSPISYIMPKMKMRSTLAALLMRSTLAAVVLDVDNGPVLTGVSPSRVGRLGSARLRLQGSNLHRATNVTVDGQPCAKDTARSDPLGTFLTCFAPALSQPTVARVSVNSGVSCDGCTVSYEDGLVPSMHYSVTKSTLTAGDMLHLSWERGTLPHFSSPTQLRITLGSHRFVLPIEVRTRSPFFSSLILSSWS